MTPTHELVLTMRAWLREHPAMPRRITSHIEADVKILEAYLRERAQHFQTNGKAKPQK